MQHFNAKKLTVAAVVAGLSCLAIGAPAGLAKTTKKVTFTNTGNPDNLNGTLKGTLGKGKQSGQLLLPKIKYVWKYKGGTIYATGKTGPIDGSVFTGTWKINKGTGKFKGITGKGTFRGDAALATPVFTFKGKVTY